MQFSEFKIKQLFLALSIILYLLTVSDTFLFHLHSGKTIIIPRAFQTAPRDQLIVPEINLSSNLQVIVPIETYQFIRKSDSCILLRTAIFKKIAKVNVYKGNAVYPVNIGTLNEDKGLVILGFETFVAILAALLFFTKIFNKFEAMDFGPYVVFLFSVIFFILYMIAP